MNEGGSISKDPLNTVLWPTEFKVDGLCSGPADVPGIKPQDGLGKQHLLWTTRNLWSLYNHRHETSLYIAEMKNARILHSMVYEYGADCKGKSPFVVKIKLKSVFVIHNYLSFFEKMALLKI